MLVGLVRASPAGLLSISSLTLLFLRCFTLKDLTHAASLLARCWSGVPDFELPGVVWLLPDLKACGDGEGEDSLIESVSLEAGEENIDRFLFLKKGI